MDLVLVPSEGLAFRGANLVAQRVIEGAVRDGD